MGKKGGFPLLLSIIGGISWIVSYRGVFACSFDQREEIKNVQITRVLRHHQSQIYSLAVLFIQDLVCSRAKVRLPNNGGGNLKVYLRITGM